MLDLLNFNDWADAHPDIVKPHHLSFVEERAVEPVSENVQPEPSDDEAPQEQLPVNEWTVTDWKKVPGVGVVLAMRIVENGPYESLDDLRRVKGVSDKVINGVVELLA